MKDGTDSKLKFRQLQKLLGLSLWQARGLLDTLWDFVRKNCPRGDIGRFTDQEIAMGLDWTGDAETLVRVLVETRWLDENAQERPETFSGVTGAFCRLVVHDWPEHCEDSVHKTLIKTLEIFADGTFPSLARIEKNKRPQIVSAYQHKYGKEAWKNGKAFKNAQERPETPKNAPTIPSLAIPSPTIPSPAATTEGGKTAAAAVEVLISYGAEAGVAKRAVEVATSSGVTPEQIFAIIDFWKCNRGWGIGALLCRIENATRRSDPTMGWPERYAQPSNGKPTPSKAAIESANWAAANKIIKAGQVNGKSDDDIRAELTAAGLEWP